MKTIPDETIEEFFDGKPNTREYHILLNKLLDGRGIDNPTVFKKSWD